MAETGTLVLVLALVLALSAVLVLVVCWYAILSIQNNSCRLVACFPFPFIFGWSFLLLVLLANGVLFAKVSHVVPGFGSILQRVLLLSQTVIVERFGYFLELHSIPFPNWHTNKPKRTATNKQGPLAEYDFVIIRWANPFGSLWFMSAH